MDCERLWRSECSLRSSGLARTLAHERRLSAVANDSLGDDDIGDVGLPRQLVHQIEQQPFHDRPQTARARTMLDGLLGDRAKGPLGEVELDALEREEALVLLDERVLRLREDLDE